MRPSKRLRTIQRTWGTPTISDSFIDDMENMEAYLEEVTKFLHRNHFMYNPPSKGQWRSQEAKHLHYIGCKLIREN